jgi:hypothetical protein
MAPPRVTIQMDDSAFTVSNAETDVNDSVKGNRQTGLRSS